MSICNDDPSRLTKRLTTSTKFICALVITNSCLRYLQALTSNQDEAQDIVSAVTEIDHNNSGQVQTHCEKMCTDVGTVPSLPRSKSIVI